MRAEEYLDKIRRMHSEGASYLLVTNELKARKKCCELLADVARSVVDIRSTRYDSPHITGGKPCDISDKLVRLNKVIDKTVTRIINKQVRYVKALAVALAVINSIEDSGIRAVMIDFYCSQLEYPKIAKRQHISEITAYRWIKKGNKELNERYKDFEKYLR